MTKYHINYDGNILPCRAKVKKCPYGDDRHGNSYEELYPLVDNTYNSKTVHSKELQNRIKSGAVLSNLSIISDELETTNAPIEKIISTLGFAVENVGVGNLPNTYKRSEEELERLTYDFLSHRMDPPRNMPDYIKERAREEWVAAGRPSKGAWAWGNREKAERLNQRARELGDDMKEINEWKSTHVQLSPENTKKYRQAIEKDYNRYSKALNTSKLIAQSSWSFGNSQDEIQNNLHQISEVELLSLYDSLTISDKEIEKNLEEIDDFNYYHRNDLSDKANENVNNWFNRNKELSRRYRVQSSERILLSILVTKELINRNVEFGDIINTQNERIY